MGAKTLIGWCDHTLNFWWGCSKVSAECHHCYIGQIMRCSGREPFHGPMRTSKGTCNQAAKWDRMAARDGARRRVFTCSMSDFFDPGTNNWRQEAWEVIRRCEHLDWLVLTKRPELIDDRLPTDWNRGYPNVWLGVTCGKSSSLHRVRALRSIPAAVRFISAEPLLEAIDFRRYLDGRIHWIITGCERTHKDKRRLMDLDWVRDIDRQCQEAGVAHFFKQRYINNKGVPVEDGLLDGVRRQDWPSVAHSL